MGAGSCSCNRARRFLNVTVVTFGLGWLSLVGVGGVAASVKILSEGRDTVGSRGASERFCGCLLLSSLSELLIFSKSLEG